jgi:hypothetical protein
MRTTGGETPLHLAAGYGLPVQLDDPDPERRDFGCRMQIGGVKIAEKLVALGARLKPDALREPVAQDATDALGGLMGLCSQQLNRGKLRDALGKAGVDLATLEPPLGEWLASEPRYLEVARLLLARQADVNALCKLGQTPLWQGHGGGSGTPLGGELGLVSGGKLTAGGGGARGNGEKMRDGHWHGY